VSRRALVGAIPSGHRAWPDSLEPADEYGGEEWLLERGDYENFVRFSGGRSHGVKRAQWAAMDARWCALFLEVLRGGRGAEDPEFLELSAKLALDHEIPHDRRRAALGEATDAAALRDLAEDHAPDLPTWASDRVLGPWADEGYDRALAGLAVEVMAYLPVLRGDVSLVDRWSETRPYPPLPQRRALRATAHAPAMLWAVSPEGWRPLLPLSDRMAPPGPVAGPITPLPGVRRVVAAVARVHPGPERHEGTWIAEAALGLGALPPAGALRRRLTLTLWRLRRLERRATWEDVLRRRPELVYRFCAAWWWSLHNAGESGYPAPA
jgi:hypothetical protein